MTFIVPSEKTEHSPPGLITKDSDHPLSATLLGTVYAAHWLGDAIVLYYQDGHKAFFKVGEEGNLLVGDYEVPRC